MAKKKPKDQKEERDQCDMCGSWFFCSALTTHFWSDMNDGNRIRKVAPNVHLCYSCLDESRYFREVEHYKKTKGGK